MTVPSSDTPPPSPVPLLSLYRVFFVLGLLSFGGGVSAWMHREVVQVRRWMTDAEFISGFALAQILPGVNSANLAVYLGQYLRGAAGAAVALVGMLTGPFIVVIVAAMLYHRLVGLPGFAAATAGIAAVAVGMLLRLGFTLAGRVPRRVTAYAVMAATFLAVGVLNWPLVPVVAVMAPISIIAAWPRGPGGPAHA
jgi:chromate transporter